MTEATTHRIEVRVRELNQLFNSMDPSPFIEKELDANAEDFIVGWAREIPKDAGMALVVHIEQVPDVEHVQTIIAEAVHHFFNYRQSLTEQKLQELTRGGWKDLLRGLVFLGVCIVLANLIDSVSTTPLAAIARESVIIGGWVAMWRPMEIFLYERWPLRERAALYRRLSRVPVEIRAGG